ncbi:MAG TPA: NAD-dependent epimerase/dehydratase family protein [Longimicrobiales bacterium]|nr:NAD-dependent epimerase/dehydratase family protein [Longimicrobiales bacterium]
MIYLTGATGFIGSRVARRLLALGEQLRCLVRSQTKSAWLAKAGGVDLLFGNIDDVDVHERGMRGASSAIHLAAIYDLGIVDEVAMRRTNVSGTRAFLEGARRAKVARSIYVSTTVALGPGVAEPLEAYDGPYHSVYHQTKAEAHRLARSAQRAGDPVIIVCPSFVYGPGDEGPAGRFVDDIRHRKLPALLSDPAHFSFVFVDDVADAIVAALKRGGVGEVYLFTGVNASMNEFATAVAREAKVKAPALRFPVAIARPLGRVLDVISRATRMRFPINYEGVVTTSRDKWLHTHERAAQDLDYAPRSIEEGLRATLRDENLPPEIVSDDA